MKTIATILIGSLMLACALGVAAQECVEYGHDVEVLWTVEANGGANDLAVRDGLMVTVNHYLLLTYDVSGDTPQYLGWASLPGNGRCVELSGDYALVADEDNVHLFDISSPAAPVLLDSETVRAVDLALAGDLVFVAGETEGLSILGIGAGGTLDPVSLTITPNGNALAVAVEGGLAIVRDEDDVALVDVSDPINPVFTGMIDLSDPVAATDVGLMGDVAVVVATTGLRTYDVSDPGAPVELDAHPSHVLGHHLDIVGDQAYVAYTYGFLQFDLGDPAALELFSNFRVVPNAGTRIDVHQDKAYVCGTWATAAVICVLLDGSYMPDYLDVEIGLASQMEWMDAQGDLAALASEIEGVVFCDLSDPQNVVRLATLPGEGFRNALFHGNYLFVHGIHGDEGDGHVSCYDISDLNEPILLDKEIIGAWYSTDCLVDHDRQILYLVSRYVGLYAVDISDPSNINLLSLIPVGDFGFLDMEFWEEFVYIRETSGNKHVYDMTDPSAPALVATAHFGSAAEMFVEGGLLYFAGDSILSVYEIQSSGIPKLLGSVDVDTSHITDMFVLNGIAYLSNEAIGDDPGGLKVCDVSDPISPRYVGAIEGESLRYIRKGTGDFLVIWMFAWGIATASLQCPDLTMIEDELPSPAPGLALTSHPNPFNPMTTIEYRMPATGCVDLAVYDVSGRRVRVLEAGVREAGVHAVTWNGRDDDGRALASGIYLVRLNAGEMNGSAKLVLMK